MMPVKYSVFTFMLVVVACSNTPESTPPPGAEQFIHGLMQDNHIPGLAIAVSREGESLWIQGFGYADLEHKVPVDPEKTRFRIASISKTLTSAGLGILMEQNKINLDVPIQTYVPYFPKKTYPVSTRQIAGHIGGIRGYKDQEIYSARRYNSTEESLKIFSSDSLIHKPGDTYSYSTLGFSLLAAAIEGISGSEYLAFMDHQVFQPIGMYSTIADWTDTLIMHRAGAYVKSGVSSELLNARQIDQSYKWAGAGFLSTATDLLKFGNAILYNRLFSSQTKDILTSTQYTMDGEPTDYGMGWALGTTDSGIDYYGHFGGGLGGRSSFFIYPEHEIVIVILTNCTQINFAGIHLFAGLFIDNL